MTTVSIELPEDISGNPHKVYSLTLKDGYRFGLRGGRIASFFAPSQDEALQEVRRVLGITLTAEEIASGDYSKYKEAGASSFDVGIRSIFS